MPRQQTSFPLQGFSFHLNPSHIHLPSSPLAITPASIAATSFSLNPTPTATNIPTPSYTTIVSSKPKTLPDNYSSGMIYHHDDVVCMRIDEAAYLKRGELCKNSLIGRVTLLKGESPWKYVDMKKKKITRSMETFGLLAYDLSWKKFLSSSLRCSF